MATLPYAANKKIIANPVWQVNTKKITMEAGSTYLSVTRGFRPTVEIASITWLCNATEAAVVYANLMAGKVNGLYDYTCPVRGAITLRPEGDITFPEPETDEYILISATFRRVG